MSLQTQNSAQSHVRNCNLNYHLHRVTNASSLVKAQIGPQYVLLLQRYVQIQPNPTLGNATEDFFFFVWLHYWPMKLLSSPVSSCSGRSYNSMFHLPYNMYSEDHCSLPVCSIICGSFLGAPRPSVFESLKQGVHATLLFQGSTCKGCPLLFRTRGASRRS